MRHISVFSPVVAALTLGLGAAMAVAEESTPAPAPTSSHRVEAGLSLATGGGVAAQGPSVTAVSVTAPGPAAAPSSVGHTGPVDQKPEDPDRDARDIERVRLACEPVSTDRHRGVVCKWSEARSDDARGYALVRSIDGGPAERIFQEGIEGPNHHVDTTPRPGHRYTYVVLVLDEAGEVIGHSDPATVGWPSSEPPTAGFTSR